MQTEIQVCNEWHAEHLLMFLFDRQFQQRMSYELLSGLANCLLNDTIFKIVEGLTEIQQVTEKQLLQHRMQMLHRHRGTCTFTLNYPCEPFLNLVI